MDNIDIDVFRDVMAAFPSGVTIVTAVDPSGEWVGFTASSFCSVSINPYLVLVCIAKTARSHSTFEIAPRWTVNIVPATHTPLALTFATRGAEKFAEGHFVEDEHGLPVMEEATANLLCTTYARYPGGDHTILVGQVVAATINESRVAAIYYRREFHSLTSDCARTVL
jgi:flavin reductase ActVB